MTLNVTTILTFGQARQHAEGALVRLSIESANRVIIIDKLVEMLADKAGSAQEQAAAALANLASDSAENRVSIVDAGGIAPLLTLLLDGSSTKAKVSPDGAVLKLAAVPSLTLTLPLSLCTTLP